MEHPWRLRISVTLEICDNLTTTCLQHIEVFGSFLITTRARLRAAFLHPQFTTTSCVSNRGHRENSQKFTSLLQLGCKSLCGLVIFLQYAWCPREPALVFDGLRRLRKSSVESLAFSHIAARGAEEGMYSTRYDHILPFGIEVRTKTVGKAGEHGVVMPRDLDNLGLNWGRLRKDVPTVSSPLLLTLQGADHTTIRKCHKCYSLVEQLPKIERVALTSDVHTPLEWISSSSVLSFIGRHDYWFLPWCVEQLMLTRHLILLTGCNMSIYV